MHAKQDHSWRQYKLYSLLHIIPSFEYRLGDHNANLLSFNQLNQYVSLIDGGQLIPGNVSEHSMYYPTI